MNRIVREHVDLALHPFTYFTCGEAIAGVGHLELIFTSCPYSSFLRKNSLSRAKTNSKGVPRPTLSEIDKSLNEKNRPVPNWRRALVNWRRALARKSSYFDKIADLSNAKAYKYKSGVAGKLSVTSI